MYSPTLTTGNFFPNPIHSNVATVFPSERNKKVRQSPRHSIGQSDIRINPAFLPQAVEFPVRINSANNFNIPELLVQVVDSCCLSRGITLFSLSKKLLHEICSQCFNRVIYSLSYVQFNITNEIFNQQTAKKSASRKFSIK